MCLVYLAVPKEEFMKENQLEKYLEDNAIWVSENVFVDINYELLQVNNKYLEHNQFTCFGAKGQLYTPEKLARWEELADEIGMNESQKKQSMDARIWEAKRATKLFEEDYALWMKVFQGYLEKHSQIGIYYAYEEDRRYHKVIPIQFKEVTKDVIASLEAHTLLLIHR